jgi:hypothetical protein
MEMGCWCRQRIVKLAVALLAGSPLSHHEWFRFEIGYRQLLYAPEGLLENRAGYEQRDTYPSP